MYMYGLKYMLSSPYLCLHACCNLTWLLCFQQLINPYISQHFSENVLTYTCFTGFYCTLQQCQARSLILVWLFLVGGTRAKRAQWLGGSGACHPPPPPENFRDFRHSQFKSGAIVWSVEETTT